MYKIEIIPLALKKINQREIPLDWIYETLKFSEQTIESYLGRKIYHKKYKVKDKDMLLRVVAEEESSKLIVITAYLTSRFERYGGDYEGSI